MRQYIKKALWIIPFVFSLNLSAQTTYYFVGSAASNGSTYGIASDLGNWNTDWTKSYTSSPSAANGNPTNMTTTNDLFNLNGNKIDLAGCTVGAIIFDNDYDGGGTEEIYNSGTVTCNNPTAPIFDKTFANLYSTHAYNVNLEGGASSTISYTASSTQEIIPVAHNNITISNSNKTVSSNFSLKGLFTSSSGSLTITINGEFIIGSSASFNVTNSTKFILKGFNTRSKKLITDSRTTNTYPGIWEASYSNASTPLLHNGTYYDVIISETTSMLGNIKITNNLTLNNSGKNFNINGKTLTLEGNISNSSGSAYLIGSNTSNLICSTATTTLYFDQNNNGNKSLKNLTVTNGANVTLGNSLLIVPGTYSSSTTYSSGTVIVNSSSTLNTNNNLTLQSDINNTARIGESTGTINGRYYAERYFPLGDRDYRFICAPVKGATALQWRANGSSTTGIGIHITGANGSTDSFDATTANKPSAFYYDEANAGDVTAVNSSGTDDPGWQSITKGGHYQLTNGTGFRVLIRGDRGTSLTTSNPSASATTITSYGSYPRTSGTGVLISVTNHNRSKTNDGMNLIGNPYPSAINWNAISLSNVDDGYALYNPSGNRYEAWNGSLGDATQYISSGQAFFVFCNNSSGGSLTIDENDKYDGRGGNFFLEKLSNHMRINLMYDSNYNSNAFIHFRDDASDVKDVYDIQQFYVNGTNIASLDKNGKPYKINSLKTLDSLTVVPLSIAGTPEASLKLSFYDVPSFYGYKLELVDTYLKKTVEITEGMIYNLDITSDSFTVKDGRFYINIAKIPGLKNRSLESNKIANIYPNPIQDKMAISLDKKITQANYEIFNSIGQLITKGTIESPQSTINTSSYSNGTYYLIVKTNNSSQTIQFVK